MSPNDQVLRRLGKVLGAKTTDSIRPNLSTQNMQAVFVQVVFALLMCFMFAAVLVILRDQNQRQALEDRIEDLVASDPN